MIYRFPALLALFILLGISGMAQPLHAETQNLPSLGDSTSAIVSPQQEHDIGQAFLRLYRSQVPEFDDPLLTDYLEKLLARIAQYSQLEDKHLDLIVISSPQINAFAAPGGIVGVNSGTFLYTQSESELAGVLSHELGHLSQHHYARGVEESQKASLPTIAGMLGGLILMGTGAGNAGMAAIATTQAANMQSALHFSRQHEQEADNEGFKTLVAAGFDPGAMTSMFEHMLDSTRFMGQKVPEFLLDHPVTEQRIAESRARLENITVKDHYDDNLEFQLMCARVRLFYEESPQIAIKRFRSEIDGASLSVTASRYGLALAQMKAQQYDDAEKNLDALMNLPLLRGNDVQNTFLLTHAQLQVDRTDFDKALGDIQHVLQKDPGHYPARLLQARIFMQEKRYPDAEMVLQRLSVDRPGDAQVWYELAEARGMSGNAAGVYLARAEFFILNGIFDKAKQQLGFAQKALANNYVASEKIKQRLLDVDALEKNALKL
jgi:predicted Zn-dependent protease